MDFLRVTVCVNLNLLRQLPAEGLVQQGFFEVVEGGDFGGVIKTQLRKLGCLKVG